MIVLLIRHANMGFTRKQNGTDRLCPADRVHNGGRTALTARKVYGDNTNPGLMRRKRGTGVQAHSKMKQRGDHKRKCVVVMVAKQA